ncbi:MAG TPA: ribonuclease III [Blastocatellia bacterium]|nr:ribonuclease III [Blastocatellia bacterium]
MISVEREKLLSELEQKVGYSFRSRALLDRALTHRSFANEQAGDRGQHNEALEFLGDSVLGFVVSAWLLEGFPDLPEGKLSKMKAHLVNESSLAELADEIDLGRYILLNRGEEKTGGRRKRALLADAYEALIGAIYIDCGIAGAERFLRRELRDKVASIDPSGMIGADYKSTLQERLQGYGAPVPEYAVVEALGPDHRRTFRVELRIGGRPLGVGEGHTIKLAQQDAAQQALAEPGAIERLVEERAASQNSHRPSNEPPPSYERTDALGTTAEPIAAPIEPAPDFTTNNSVPEPGARRSVFESEAQSETEARGASATDV